MQIKDGVLLKAYNSDLINGALAIPDGIHTIGMLAFDSCENLTTIIIHIENDEAFSLNDVWCNAP